MADAAVDIQAAMKETKSSAFARALGVEPKKLRSYCRNTLKFRTSEQGPLTAEVQEACIKHFLGDEAVETAPKKRARKASK